VLRGTVSLSVRLNHRREISLGQLSPGALFGGLPLVADLPNQESAVADCGTKLLERSRGSFSYLRVAKPLLAQRLAQLVTRLQLGRLRRLVDAAARSEGQ
jgi:CRP-like cAMP-binding protein